MNNFCYLSYDEYVDFGGQLDLQSFNGYSYLAQTTVDYYTFNRLHKVEFDELPERTQFAIKQCIIKLIELFRVKEGALGITESGVDNNNIVSQSNDGVSITYGTLPAQDKIIQTNYAMQSTVKTMLEGCKLADGRKLLYRGLYADE